MNCDVLLFAAGEGRRLRPLTEITPKPLLQVANKPLIQWSLELIARAGFKRVIVNTYYLAEQIEGFLRNYDSSLEIVISREERLLSTGGTIKNIEPLLREQQLLTINSDTLYSPCFDLSKVVIAHRADMKRPLVTMVLGGSQDVGYYGGGIGIAETGRVVAFRGAHLINEPISQTMIYSGISVINTELLRFMPERGNVFCLCNDTYKNILKDQRVISSYCYNGYWSDVGTVEALERSDEDFKAGRII